MSTILVQNQLVANSDLGSVFKNLLPGPAKKCGMYGSSNGVNVVLCNDEGFQVTMHELMVRRFTNLLDAFDSTSIEELRDPFGALVIILQGVEDEILRALLNLLYTGVCQITSEESKLALKQILSSSVTSQLWGASKIPKIKTELLGIKSEDIDSDVFDMQSTIETDISDTRGSSVVGVEIQPSMGNEKDAETDISDILGCFEVGTEYKPSIKDKIAQPKGQVENERHSDNYLSDRMHNAKDSDIGEKNEGSHYDASQELECNKKIQQSLVREKAFLCSLCGKQFSDTRHLKEHERRNTGEKPYQCSQCDIKFRRWTCLKKHEYNAHPGSKERPFKCSHCKKYFYLKKNLELHEQEHKVHKSEKPKEMKKKFPCVFCNKSFKSKSARYSHQRAVKHPGTIFARN